MNTLPAHLLPDSLKTIADYCGEEIMWTIWEHYAGGRLHVPIHPDSNHKLIDILGYAGAIQFCSQFGGEFLRIDKAENAKRAVRNTLIRQAKAEGLDNFTLARRFNLTDRQIMKICAASDEPAVNFDLFD